MIAALPRARIIGAGVYVRSRTVIMASFERYCPRLATINEKSALAVPEDGVRDVGLLETVCLLLGQRELPGGQGVGDVTEPVETTPDVDAIFVASDLMATAVLQVLTAGGRRVPNDVAVVGFDDSPPARMTTPALSTVHQPVEKLAALAVRTLTDRGAPPDQRLPTRLVVRASSAS